MKINVIDLFAGCGGLTDGFLQTGKFKTLAAVDWEQPMVKTLRNRLGSRWGYKSAEHTVLHFDIQRSDELLYGYDDPIFGTSKGLISLSGQSPVNMIVGGPPCQAYSIAGRVQDKNGMKDDYRNFLFESYAKMVNHFQPHSFVFENVEGILSAAPGGIPITSRIRKAFQEIGYEITSDLRRDAVFDTSYYNVPQKRKRVIIYGVKTGEAAPDEIKTFYRMMRQRESAEPAVAGTAFENLPAIFPLKEKEKGKSHSVYVNGTPVPPNHIPRVHSERDIKVFNTLAEDIENGTYKYCSTAALINLYEEATGKKSNFHKYHVIRKDKPGNTIPAHLYKDGLRHIHPDPKQARSITVREAARIQSFDDDFEFLGSQGFQYKMIGNAVPPLFARAIAETAHFLFERSSKKVSEETAEFQVV
ncbi:MAG: DNA cytosine methyltransferase [Chryseobacterium sp.]|nr:MAG: DNA cytosine methyltransferase [Chryseobacterium sp.]